MIRPLERVFRIGDRNIGIPTKEGGPQKRIRSPNSGKIMSVPGYENDFMWQNDIKIVEVNPDKLTDPNAHWMRDNIQRIRKRDMIHLAIAEIPNTTKRVREE